MMMTMMYSYDGHPRRARTLSDLAAKATPKQSAEFQIAI